MKGRNKETHASAMNPEKINEVLDALEKATSAAGQDMTEPPAGPDDESAEPAPRSILQHAAEILAPIAAFLAVAILTVPISQAVRQEMPGMLPAVGLLVLRVWIAYKAARFAARWVADRF